MIYTLNDMVKHILLAMDSADINSIDDTVESVQVATLIKTVYYDLSTDLGLPEHQELFNLESSGDTNRPVLMTLPSNVTDLVWIKYDNAASTDSYADPQVVRFMDFHDFMDSSYSLRNQSSGVGEMTFNSNKTEDFKVMYRTDRDPQFWTSMDDRQILFNSYDSSEDSILQASKTTCFGSVYPLFELTDEFTPDLDPTGFSLLLNRSKARAFMEIKQQQNPDAAQEARRQKIINQKRQRTLGKPPKLYEYVRYGRKGAGYVDHRIPSYLKQGD